MSHQHHKAIKEKEYDHTNSHVLNKSNAQFMIKTLSKLGKEKNFLNLLKKIYKKLYS